MEDGNIGDLKFDDKNFNKHTEFGMSTLERSLRDYGAGRSVLVDKDNNIIAGNGIVEAAGSIGITKTRIIETTGDELVVVRRKDITLDSKEGRGMALADNATAAADLSWDQELVTAEADKWDLDLDDWGIDFPAPKLYEDGTLSREFIVPPFTVLDTRTTEWLQRKRAWQTVIEASEKGRGVNLLGFSGSKVMPSREGYTSIFDPVLCEIIYRWFNVVGGSILDPFAGGSVRGIVAGTMGMRYHGNDLSATQVEEDRDQANIAQEKIGDQFIMPKYTIGDSCDIDKIVAENSDEQMFDLVMSCPPYADLEQYSDDKKDLSNMDYEDFLTKYREIIRKSVAMLKPNRFAVFVVGEIRDPDGKYRNFVGDTVQAFIDAGLRYYNHAILVNRNGSAGVRARKQMANRKLVHTHQNVIVGVKGDADADVSSQRIKPNDLAKYFNESGILQDQHEEIVVFSNAEDFSKIKDEYRNGWTK